METSKSFNIFLLITAALLAGLIGSWFFSYGRSASFNNFSNNNGQLIIQDAKNVVVEQDNQAVATVVGLHKVMLGLYPANSQAVYNLTQPQAQGLIITSDGWFLTNQVIDDNWVAVTKDKDVYTIDKVVLDEKTGFIFAHVVGVNDLPVSRFAKTNELRIGQSVVGVNWFGQSWISILSNIERPLLKSSQDIWRKLSLIPNSLTVGQLVVADLGGRVIGLLDAQSNLRTTDYVVAMINNLLNKKDLVSPYLGVNYQDLSLLTNQSLKHGAELISVNGSASVISGSPAAIAGLQSGDVITAINGFNLNGVNDLAEELLRYQPGDKINLTYWRDQKEKTVEVVLTEM